MPRVLRAVINDYLKRCGIEIVPHLEIDNFTMAISLVASTRGATKVTKKAIEADCQGPSRCPLMA
jgi:LysR family hca operon transcriptional activator